MRFVQEIRIAMFAAVCGSVLLTGCGTTSLSRFYTLPPVQPAATETRVLSPEAAVTLSVGPISIPDYLDRPQIVVRSTQNELLLSEFNRWAGSLQSDTARVLRENLEKMLAGDGISVTSWRRGIPSVYRVSVDVSRFEVTAETGVVLKAQWAVFGGDGANVLLVRDSDIREEVRGGGIEPVVTAMGRALGSLSREIAQGVSGVKAAAPGKSPGKTG
jgi:uncharacterized lipoprotein YmbA